ncbi:MAG: ROK family protein [Halanaerobiales bacterium]|nr:ROK family protein [Halanaerobiales bacterium]
MIHQQKLESKNLKKVFYLFLENEFLTRRDIVSITNLTYPTVGKMIEMLLHEELIVLEGMSKSTRGRRPEKYKINYQRFFVIGVRLKLDQVKMSLISLAGKIMEEQDYDIDYSVDVEGRLAGIIKNFIARFDYLDKKVLGISISFPGPVDNYQSKCFYSTIIKVKNSNLKSFLEEKSKIPVWIENDVNLMAMGENYFGDINFKKGLIYFFWGTGIGSAMMFGDNSVKSEFAGQIGHVVVEPRGELCFCGKRGCLETVLSQKSLINQVKVGLDSNVKSSLHKYKKIELIDILREAHQGDSLSNVVLEKIEQSLGLALVNYIELFDPDLLILNGDIFNKAPFLVEQIKEYIYSQIMFKNQRKLDIFTSKLKDEAELLGLLVLSKEKELGNKLDILFGYNLYGR